MKKIALVLASLALTFLAIIGVQDYYPEQCYQKRYVFDIGSGSTKIAGAVIDTCLNRMVEHYPQDSMLMEYQKCIDSATGTIQKQCMDQGYNVIEALKAKYGALCDDRIDQCVGFATAWARNASNAGDFIEYIKDHSGVHAQVLSQEEEGKIGFKAAIFKLQNLHGMHNQDDLVVLDIGGGSFQLSGMDDAVLKVMPGMYGMYNFPNSLAKHFQLSSSGHVIPDTQIDAVVAHMVTLFKEELSKHPWLSTKMSKKSVKVIGVGTLLNVGLRQQLELGGVITKKALHTLAHQLAKLNQQGLHQRYPALPTRVMPYIQPITVLIYSIMETLGVDEMQVLDVGLAEYLVITERNWPFKAEAMKHG